MSLSNCARARGAIAVSLMGFLAACAETPSGPVGADAVRAPLNFATSTARPDRYVVSFTGAEPAGFAANVQSLGGTVERRLPGARLAVVSGVGTAGATNLRGPGIELVAQDLEVQFIPAPDPSRFQRHSVDAGAVRPNGTDQSGAFFFPYQWNMRQVSANAAWGSTPGGSGEIVCLLDTGIDPDHLDLQGKVIPSALVSFISAPLFPGDLDPIDYNFHGTASAGHISSNGIGMASVAPDASLCSAKVLNVLGSGSFADVISAIIWATESARADVINMSLGAYVNLKDPGVSTLVAFLQRAVDVATSRGVLVVASAGNDAIDLNADSKNFRHIPSELKNVVSVGATAPVNQANFDGLASYSNYGSSGVDLMAPGGDFAGSTALDGTLTACSQYQLTLPFACSFADYLFVAGTSESAPHVSGAAAVVESQAGPRSPGDLSACLLRTADEIGPKRIFAAGRLDVAAAAGCF